jgi:hypothetical protein
MSKTRDYLIMEIVTELPTVLDKSALDWPCKCRGKAKGISRSTILNSSPRSEISDHLWKDVAVQWGVKVETFLLRKIRISHSQAKNTPNLANVTQTNFALV